MSFRSPWMLTALVIVPALVAAHIAGRRRRARHTAALAGDGLVAVSTSGGRRIRHLPFALIIVAVVVLVVAMARPAASVATPRREATVILAIDVSNSMAATDVTPSRFEAAKTAARTFVDRQPASVRIGVVAFGAGAVSVQEPTNDHVKLDAAITQLSRGGGTSLGDGLLTALGVIAGKPLSIDTRSLADDNAAVNIGYFGGATIVVFSDGENLSNPDPVAIAGVASVAGVRIQTIGVGTEAGTVVQVDGFSEATALNRDLLESLAKTTNGSYHQAEDRAGLAAISKQIDLHFKIVHRHTEITGLFSAAGAVLLLAGAMWSLLWFGRVV